MAIELSTSSPAVPAGLPAVSSMRVGKAGAKPRFMPNVASAKKTENTAASSKERHEAVAEKEFPPPVESILRQVPVAAPATIADVSKPPSTPLPESTASAVRMADFAKRRKRGEQAEDRGVPMQNSSANFEVAPRVPYRRASTAKNETLPSADGLAMGTVVAPQVRLVDGQVVLDNQTLLMTESSSQRDQLERQQSNLVVVQEASSAHRHFTSATHSRYSGSNRWTPAQTELFYQALEMCGTDFGMIASVFPGRTRAQVKNKFKAEERANPEHINRILWARPKPFDPSVFTSQAQ